MQIAAGILAVVVIGFAIWPGKKKPAPVAEKKAEEKPGPVTVHVHNHAGKKDGAKKEDKQAPKKDDAPEDKKAPEPEDKKDPEPEDKKDE